ncbi:MAG: NADPH2:quinone reductase [Gammaproteobacteria bacterium]|jgi:NADPH2:quinone reductase
MKAVLVTPGAPANLALGEAPAPDVDSDQTLVRVKAVSLNRGEVRRAQAMSEGSAIGWDFAGIVEAPARDGSGPAAGARVVGLSLPMRGWAELVAVDSRSVTVVPDAVSLEDASTLPVAGLTALYGLERGDRLLGAQVVVTGASGGVGYFGCQLAKMMGAQVFAQVRRDDHVALLSNLGVEEVVVDDSGDRLAERGPYRLVLDGLGGPLLGRLISMLEPDGRAVLYGVSVSDQTTIGVRDLMVTGTGRVDGFHLYRESEIASAASGLARLLGLVEQGRLQTLVQRTEPWENVGDVAQALLDRAYPGKAVLTL